MTKTIKIVLGIIIIILIIWGLKNWGGKVETPAANEPIKIGVIMPLSGELGAFGTNVSKGLEIALTQKGISTSSVKMIVENTGAFTPGAALTAFKKITEVDKVDVVIGPFGPAQTLTIAPLIGSTTPVVISVSNCDERFKNYSTLFCLYPGIVDQTNQAIEFMKAKNWKQVYFLTENSEFGLLVEKLLKERAGDVTLVGSEKVVPNQTKDFRTIITKAVAAKPDVVFAMFAPNEGFVLLRQFPTLAKNIPLYIGTDVNTGQLIDIFGEEAGNIFFASRISEQYEPDFVLKFKVTTGRDPDYFAALGHSVAIILANALKDKDYDISELTSKLINSTDPATAVKDFRFREDRTVYVPLDSYEFKNSQFLKSTP